MLEVVEADMAALFDRQAQITKHLLTTPVTIEELITMQKNVEAFIDTGIKDFTEKLQNMSAQIQKISKYTSRQLSNATRLMLDLLSWHLGCDKMLEASKKITDLKTEEFTSSLVSRREKITEELDLIDHLVTDLSTNNDSEEVSKYKRRTNSLEARLEDLFNRIKQLNKEEELFQWELTYYPQSAQIATRLAPFVRLYDIASDFGDKSQQW